MAYHIIHHACIIQLFGFQSFKAGLLGGMYLTRQTCALIE